MADRLCDFVVLGHSPEAATGWPHPVTIAVLPRGSSTLLNISMGPHIANVGGQLPVTRVIAGGELRESFSEEFDACRARWLVPYLARLASGEAVTEDELVAAYRARSGVAPRVEQAVDHSG